MDLDVDNNAKLSYSIYESNGTKASDTFDINSSTGELFLKQNALALGIFPKFRTCLFTVSKTRSSKRFSSQRSVSILRSSRRSRLSCIGHRSSS